LDKEIIIICSLILHNHALITGVSQWTDPVTLVSTQGIAKVVSVM